MNLFNKVFTLLLWSFGLLGQPNRYCNAQVPEFEWAKQATQSEGHSIAGTAMESYSIAGTMWDSVVFVEPGGNQTFQTSYIRGLNIHDRNDEGMLNWFGGLDVGVSWINHTRLHITKDAEFSYFAGMVGTFPNWDLDPGPDTIAFSLVDDAIVVKFLSKGNILWVRAIMDSTILNQEPHDIAVDSEGNVYTCGYFKGSPDFDPGPDTLILEAHAAGSGFIHKMDADGNLLWTGVPGEYGHVNAIAIDEWDNVFIT